MTQRSEIYKNKETGCVFEILNPGQSEFSCPAESIQKMVELNSDAGKEKHVPVLISTEHGVKIIVGSVAHPMDADHFIEWIEVINGSYVNRKYLKPGDLPEAEFYVPNQPGLIVRAYCNKHGLWKL